jgi:hypothetical protein
MVRKGPTKRKRGDIWAQLGVSACVLLLPPFVMAAGVMFLGSSPSQDIGPEGGARQAGTPETVINKSVSVAERSDIWPDIGPSFALASADQHPVLTEQRASTAQPSVASRPAAGGQTAASVQRQAQPTGTAQRQAGSQPAAATAQRQADAQPAATKDPARYLGPAPVTLVNAEKANEQSAMAEIEAPASTAKAADAPGAVPEKSPSATRIHAFHGRSRTMRHEPRAVYRVRQPQQRTRSLSDIFVRPTARPRTTHPG